MRIGITERGDASLDFSWVQKIDSVDGAVLITKSLNDEFICQVMQVNKPTIVHCTCTGVGGTGLEPSVPRYDWQLNQLKKLLDTGFPVERCVLRIDPIFPTEGGLQKVRKVLDYFMELQTGVKRVRVSILDEYWHVKERCRSIGCEPLYGDNFQASEEQFREVAKVLQEYPFVFETCAEDKLAGMADCFKIQGCISQTDLKTMGLSTGNYYFENPQNRNGCHCLSCKVELLKERKRCPHQCIYCYWKN